MISKKKIPNAISFLRLAGIPVVVLLLMNFSEANKYFIAGIFLFLAATDVLDGYLARKWNAVTSMGALLDPLVDKLLILAPLITMVGLRSSINGEAWVPAWLVVLLLARELWITGLRGFAANQGIVISAGELGKVKTFFQVTAVFFLILHGERLFVLGEEWITAQYVGLQCLLTAILIAYWSGAEYTMEFFQSIRGKEEVADSNDTKKKSRRLSLRSY